MPVTHDGEYHIHGLRPKRATDTYCSCPWCGLIADHTIDWLGSFLGGGFRYVTRSCVDCETPWLRADPIGDAPEPEEVAR